MTEISQPLYHEIAENAVIGAMLLDKQNAYKAISILDEEDFFQSSNREVWKAIVEMITNQEPIDEITICHRLRNVPAVDLGLLMKYMNSNTPYYGNLEAYAEIVKYWSMARQKMALIEKQRRQLNEGENPVEVTAGSIAEDTELIAKQKSNQVVELSDIGKDIFTDLELRSRNTVPVVKSGFKNYDTIIGGYRPGIHTIAGRPGKGKTTFGLNVLSNQTGAVYIASLEMTKEELAEKFVAGGTKINSKKFERPAEMSIKDFSDIATYFNETSAKSKIFIDESMNTKASQIWARVRKLKIVHDIKLVMIDYLQLMEPEKRNPRRDLEISETLRVLRTMVRDLNVPILLLSQMNRSIETRTDKKPTMADLRESGSIEQDSTTITFLYSENDEQQTPAQSEKITLYIAKNRFGMSDTSTTLEFYKSISKFY